MNYPALIVVLALILLTVLLLWYVARVARKRAQTEPQAAAQASWQRSLTNLRWSFRSAVALIEANLASRWRRYRIPWVMLLGEPGSGKTTLIESSGIDRAFKVAAGSVQHVGVGWNYFNRGVVLDVGGEYLGTSSEGGDQAWQTLLHLIEKYRPKRPIDGVVLTLSAAELAPSEHSAMEELAHKADVIHRRLWQAQSRFGIRFPVYVVITQCDRIPGFSSFARALPKHLRDGMLGWSNPYDFEAGYQSDWVEQGVSGLVANVFEVQAELLAAGRPADDPDAFVLFPSSLAAIQGALRVYLDQLFRPSAYHETFYFRGIYVSGDAGPVARADSSLAASAEPALSAYGEAAPPAPPAEALGREPVFVRDLFEQKVFAEFGLARASREALATRNRTVRILRWSTAVLGLAWFGTLVAASIQLGPKVAAYKDALDVMVKVTKERRESHANNVHLPMEWYLRNLRLLLDKIAPLGGVRLWWFSIPGSWPGVTTLHGDIRNVLDVGFQDIVFNSVRKGLSVKVSEMTGLKLHPITTELLGRPGDCFVQPDPDAGRPAPPTLAIEDFPEFTRLREQLQNAETFEANLATFDRLRKGEAGIPDLRSLLRYTWKIELPESLNEGGYQQAAMRKGYTFKEEYPGLWFAKSEPCAFDAELGQVYARFFAQNQALLLTQDVAARIAALSEMAGDAQREDTPYAQLLQQIDALDALLKSPRSRWLATSERDLGPSFDDLLQHVTGIPALGPSAAAQARVKAQAEIEKLRASLAQPSADAIGAIVRRAPDGSWALAPDVTNFEAELALLLRQRFMMSGEGRSLETNLDPGIAVRWDVKRLDEALALADEQRRFLKDNLGKFPALLQDDIESIADRHLARRMTDLIAKAESLGPNTLQSPLDGTNPEVSGNVKDFDRAGAQLVRLLGVLQDIGADSTYQDLASLLRRDAVRGLLAISRSLDGSQLYTARDGNFAWWQGTKNPALAAFRVTDPQALADFLGQQFGQVEWLAKLSAPLLSVVDSAGMQLDPEAARVVRRLRGIAREVEKYKSKNPTSSVAELESFIRTDLPAIDAQNCIPKLAPKLGTSRDADFFRERLIALRHQLYSRCVELATAESMQAYQAIEDSFGRTLAGRFPFGQQQSDLGAGYGEAEPDDVVHFLRVYDREAKAAGSFLNSGVRLPAPLASVARFVDQMSHVRTFLAPLLPTEDGAPAAGYELAIEFRVNQRAEVDGNRILDWSMSAGDRTVHLRDASHLLRWHVGMPITLTLRWAKDALTTPVNDGIDAHMVVDGKDVIYRFADPWSLVTMLETHAAAALDAFTRAELRPHMLKFEFPIQPVPTAGQYRSNLPEKRARVFIRVTVRPGGKKDILQLPVFPTQAPALPSGGANGTQQSGTQPARPGAWSGWPDEYPGMPLRLPPNSISGARRRAGGA